MKLSRRRWMTMAAIALLSKNAGATDYTESKKASTRVYSGQAFGGRWQLTASAMTDAQLAVQCVNRAVSEVNRSMSPYLASSELSMFNRLSSNAWCDVSLHFGRVLDTAMELAYLTGHAFDPTLGSLVNRFGFGPIEGAAVTGVNHIDARNNRVRKLHTGVTLDLCGVAKGYAIDLAASYLLRHGIEHFLLEVGGELIAQGQHPGGKPWTVGMEEPVPGSNALYRLLPLDSQAIATSGVKYNAYTVDQRRYSHLIDGRTQQPVAHKLLSVTVLAKSAMLADAWSTALMVKGEQSGPELARAHEISALFLSSGRDPATSTLVEQRTGNFPLQAG